MTSWSSILTSRILHVGITHELGQMHLHPLALQELDGALQLRLPTRVIVGVGVSNILLLMLEPELAKLTAGADIGVLRKLWQHKLVITPVDTFFELAPLCPDKNRSQGSGSWITPVDANG